MADQWEVLLQQDDFKALPAKEKVDIASNFFQQNLASQPEFQSLPPEEKADIKRNFFSTLQQETPFEGRHPNISAAYETVKKIPRLMASGATIGLSEKAGELGIGLANRIFGTPDTANESIGKYKKDYEDTPSMSKTVGEMAGAVVPIGAMGKVISTAVPKIAEKAGKLGANKMFPAVTKAISWAIGGAVYGAAEKEIKSDKLPTAAELGENALMWGGTEAIINSLGWGARMASVTDKLAKAYGVSSKDVLKSILTQAKQTGEPILTLASQKELAQEALKTIELAKSSPLKDVPESAIAVRDIAGIFVKKVESLVNAQKRKGQRGYEALVQDFSDIVEKDKLSSVRQNIEKMYQGKTPYVERTTEEVLGEDLGKSYNNFMARRQGAVRQKFPERTTNTPIEDMPVEEAPVTSSWPPVKEIRVVEHEPLPVVKPESKIPAEGGVPSGLQEKGTEYSQ